MRVRLQWQQLPLGVGVRGAEQPEERVPPPPPPSSLGDNIATGIKTPEYHSPVDAMMKAQQLRQVMLANQQIMLANMTPEEREAYRQRVVRDMEARAGEGRSEDAREGRKTRGGPQKK